MAGIRAHIRAVYVEKKYYVPPSSAAVGPLSPVLNGRSLQDVLLLLPSFLARELTLAFTPPRRPYPSWRPRPPPLPSPRPTLLCALPQSSAAHSYRTPEL